MNVNSGQDHSVDAFQQEEQLPFIADGDEVFISVSVHGIQISLLHSNVSWSSTVTFFVKLCLQNWLDIKPLGCILMPSIKSLTSSGIYF